MLTYSIVTILLTVAIIFWKHLSKKKKNLPPGPIRWPILGSLPQMLMSGSKYPHQQLTALAKKYGNVMSFGFGIHYTVMISKYEVMKDVLKRSETNISRYRFQFCDHRSYNKNLGVIWSYGDVWSEQRKYTMKHLRDFGFGKTRSMEETMREEMYYLVDDIRLAIESTNGIWPVDVNRLQAVPINILWSSVGGYRFDTKSERFKHHLKINSEVFEVMGMANMLSPFPFLKIFSWLSGYNRYGEVHKECQDFMKELLEEVKQRRDGRSEAESFVEVYLDEIEKNKGNPNSTMTEEQLVVVLMDLFLAGSDTTSAVFSWIILYLTMFPHVQEKARNEIIKWSKGGSELISLPDMSRMPYVRAIILESFRHPPFVSVPVTRGVSEDLECGGYVIAKGTCVVFNLYKVFHDEEFWGDHDDFRPERYFTEDDINSELVSEKVDRVCQFGFGNRICPGENMAMDSLFMFVVTLLSNFTLVAVEGEKLSYEPGKPAITIYPRPFSVNLTSLQ